jgi:hypothetical protein
MKRLARTACLLLLVVADSIGSLHATTVTTSDFLDVDGAQFAAIEQSLSLEPYSQGVGPVTVSSAQTSSSFGSLVSFDPPDPNNPAGNTIIGYHLPQAPGVLNLSEPVAAFGVTFLHITAVAPDQSPAILTVYDGPNGTGNLIGQITSQPIPPPWSSDNRPYDFVAVWTSERSIRSAVLDGANPVREASIVGMAISLVPIPEPSTLGLIVVSLGVTSFRRR